MKHDRLWVRSAQNALQVVLNQWDPLGVIGMQDDGGPYDEYECLAGPLMTLLLQEADREEVEAFLRHELDEHFSLEPAAVPREVVD